MNKKVIILSLLFLEILPAHAVNKDIKLFQGEQTFDTTKAANDPQQARVCTQTEVDQVASKATATALNACKQAGFSYCLADKTGSVFLNAVNRNMDGVGQISYQGECSAYVSVQGSNDSSFTQPLKYLAPFELWTPNVAPLPGQTNCDGVKAQIQQMVEEMADKMCVSKGGSPDTCIITDEDIPQGGGFPNCSGWAIGTVYSQ